MRTWNDDVRENPDGYKSTNVGIVDVFVHLGRVCVVSYIKFGFHCGYVEVLPHNEGKNYDEFDDIETDELTFSGYKKDYRIAGEPWFLGFDSGHYRNDENPETKTFRSVKERTIQLADEFIIKGI